MRATRKNEARGSALLAVLMVGVVALSVSLALARYSGNEWISARRATRPKQALSCAESGLQYARALFGNNYAKWDTYLSSAKSPYVNAVNSSTGTLPTKTDSNFPPELFGDLDADGKPDFFVYMRDNVDEFPTNDPTRDNDHVVFIGALCLDSALNPKDGEFSGVRSTAGLEATLAYSADVEQYQNATGTGNGN